MIASTKRHSPCCHNLDPIILGVLLLSENCSTLPLLFKKLGGDWVGVNDALPAREAKGKKQGAAATRQPRGKVRYGKGRVLVWMLATDCQDFLLVAVGTEQHHGHCAGLLVELGLEA
jgi:hypothetical protein